MLPQRVRMTAVEAEAVRRSFVRRQVGILFLSVVTLAGFLVAMSIGRWTVLEQFGAAVFVVACVVASILIWRCPRCGESFGRNWLITQCPHCFAEFTKRDQPPRSSA